MIPEFRAQLWLLAAALAIHEAEEWNIYGWYKRNYVDMPEGRTPTTIRFFLVFLSVLGFVWVGIAVCWGDSTIASWIIMPLVGLIVQNIMQHVYWQVRFKGYAPGLWTAIVLLAPLSCGIVVTSIVKAMVPLWYLVVLGVVIIPGLLDTVRARNTLTRGILAVHKFSLRCVVLLGLTDAHKAESGDTESRQAAPTGSTH